MHLLISKVNTYRYCVIFLLCILSHFSFSQTSLAFRPPAVPLITHDPYMSIWSSGDQLTNKPTSHWTGTPSEMFGMIRIDGKAYRYTTGWSQEKWLDTVAIIKQTKVKVWPTRTIFEFEAGGVRMVLTFINPALPHKLEMLSRPVSYVSWDVMAIDGAEHDVIIYYDITAEWAVNKPDSKIMVSRYEIEDIDVLRAGTIEQPILENSGDRTRIDWGHIYFAIPPQLGALNAISSAFESRILFAGGDSIPAVDDLNFPRSLTTSTTRREMPVLATQFNLGEIDHKPVHSYALIAYDDIYSLELFGKRMLPYWNRNKVDMAKMLRDAVTDYIPITAECEWFDQELSEDLVQSGGEEYAHIATLAYRQTLAAHKLVADHQGRPLYFSKEQSKDGSIGTVDVAYATSPFFLFFNPDLLKSMLIPVIEYAKSDKWNFPFAPHDLGKYPLANGQHYGGGEKSEENQMPIEESGNMLIMIGALAKLKGNASFTEPYWSELSNWAEYLTEKGFAPETQLCTDDFTQPIALHANLSLKTILALGSYAMMCEMLGKTEEYQLYRKVAEGMAMQWIRLADDGDHYRLAFDQPGTWGQKYNLVWNELLELNLFPWEVGEKEVSFYKKQLNTYGLPLDHRSNYTKLNWTLWSATLANNDEDFRAFVSPIYKFLNETPDRVPMTDWYWTHNGRLKGFRARPVVGGVFIKMLKNDQVWDKWLRRL